MNKSAGDITSCLDRQLGMQSAVWIDGCQKMTAGYIASYMDKTAEDKTNCLDRQLGIQ